MAFICYDEAFLLHDTGPGHPESGRRLRAVIRHLRERGIWDRLAQLEFRPATREEIETVHAPPLFDVVRSVSARAAHLDLDTPVGKHSFGAALLAAGAALAAADEVLSGSERRGLCLVRPPGHHAGRGRSMGFCLFNNAALCARRLLRAPDVGRVAIVDFDVHHGNGTEEVFRDDPAVFYLSAHRHPFYPGTGGHPRPPGSSAVRNVPLPAGTTPREFHAAFEEALAEVEEFAPEVVVVSAGFDGHEQDPIGGLGLSTGDYRRITESIAALAGRTAEGRIVSLLEGGYNLRLLGPSVEAHLLGLDPGLLTGS